MSNQSLVAATVCAVRTRYIQRNLAPSYFQINNGLCEDFALDVIRELRAAGIEAQDLCNENFQSGDGSWDWELLAKQWSVECPRDLLPSEVDKIRFGGHVWIEAERRFYDSECPDGVSSLFELPLFRRDIVCALRKKGIGAPEVITDDVVPAPRCPIANPIHYVEPTF